MFRKMRRFKQQLPQEDCIQVLKEGRRGVLAVNGENGYPFAFPINYIYREEDGKIYFHSPKNGYKVDCLKENDKVCFTLHDEGFKREGEWWYCVKSVICYGRIELMESNEETMEILRNFGLKYYPTVEDVDRVMKSSSSRVQMLCLTIDHMTGKFVEEE